MLRLRVSWVRSSVVYDRVASAHTAHRVYTVGAERMQAIGDDSERLEQPFFEFGGMLVRDDVAGKDL